MLLPQLVDVLKILNLAQLVLSEQVIEVPKITLHSAQCSACRSLVEVPTVVSLSFFQQHFVEQNVDIPVLGPRGVLDSGGLHGFPAGQSSTALRGVRLLLV